MALLAPHTVLQRRAGRVSLRSPAQRGRHIAARDMQRQVLLLSQTMQLDEGAPPVLKWSTLQRRAQMQARLRQTSAAPMPQRDPARKASGAAVTAARQGRLTWTRLSRVRRCSWTSARRALRWRPRTTSRPPWLLASPPCALPEMTAGQRVPMARLHCAALRKALQHSMGMTPGRLRGGDSRRRQEDLARFLRLGRGRLGRRGRGRLIRRRAARSSGCCSTTLRSGRRARRRSRSCTGSRRSPASSSTRRRAQQPAASAL